MFTGSLRSVMSGTVLHYVSTIRVSSFDWYQAISAYFWRSCVTIVMMLHQLTVIIMSRLTGCYTWCQYQATTQLQNTCVQPDALQIRSDCSRSPTRATYNEGNKLHTSLRHSSHLLLDHGTSQAGKHVRADWYINNHKIFQPTKIKHALCTALTTLASTECICIIGIIDHKQLLKELRRMHQ